MKEQAAIIAADRNSISIAMATYNGARYLPQQLTSILDQQLLPDELVVSDDGSQDQTISILERFAATAPFPVFLHRNDHPLGYRANFMTCAQRCRSTLVAFCDQDDIWMPNKLCVQQADFQAADVMLSCHNANLIDANGVSVDRQLDQFPFSCRLDLLSAGPLTFPRGFTQVVRRTLFKWEWLRQISIDIGDVGHLMSHDGWLFFIAMLHGAAIYHQEPLAAYRQHLENASGAVPSRQTRFRSRFTKRPADFERLARVWANRSDILRELTATESNLDADVSARVALAVEKYGRCAAAAEQRSVFYATAGKLRRTKLLLGALTRREFRSRDPWAFPLEGALKDATSIILS